MSLNRISETWEDLDEIIHNVKSHQDHHCLLSYKLRNFYVLSHAFLSLLENKNRIFYLTSMTYLTTECAQLYKKINCVDPVENIDIHIWEFNWGKRRC